MPSNDFARPHTDTFDHPEADIHVVVTPRDCATCHPEEAAQYAQNLRQMHEWLKVRSGDEPVRPPR